MSKPRRIPPYYFPTTVLFIDDDESFLNNLSVCLPNELAFRTYTQPQRALDLIAEVNSGHPISEQCFRQTAETVQVSPDNDLTLPINLTPITDALYTEQRFSEVSVVVIDYDMPSENGLQVCGRLDHTPLKKILLTGKADEKIAVEAFNNGLIDRFVSKGNPDMLDVLLTAIATLQQDYFNAAALPLAGVLSQPGLGFLADPQFARCFEQMREQYGWVEYYLSPQPIGMLCLSADGKITQLLVADQHQQDLSYQRAGSMAAPAEILRLIRAGEVIVDFNDNDNDSDFQWHDNIHLCQPAAAAGDWRIAVLQQPRRLKYNHDQLYNYRYYLEILHYIEHQPRSA